jgi:hypothetical protein
VKALYCQECGDIVAPLPAPRALRLCRCAFTPDPPPGSPAHVFLLRRRRWRRAVDDWLADHRPDFLVVEPTLETETTSETATEGEAR